jgi:hypothetical protein
MSSLFSERSHTAIADLLTCFVVRQTARRDIIDYNNHDDSSLLRRLTAPPGAATRPQPDAAHYGEPSLSNRCVKVP